MFFAESVGCSIGDTWAQVHESCTPSVGQYLSDGWHAFGAMFHSYLTMSALALAIFLLVLHYGWKLLRVLLGVGVAAAGASAVIGAASRSGGERSTVVQTSGEGMTPAREQGEEPARKPWPWTRLRDRLRTVPDRAREARPDPHDWSWAPWAQDPHNYNPVASADPWARDGAQPLPWPPAPVVPVMPTYSGSWPTQPPRSAPVEQYGTWSAHNPPPVVSMPLGNTGFSCDRCGGELHRVQTGYGVDPVTGQQEPGYGLVCVGRRKHGRQTQGCGTDWR